MFVRRYLLFSAALIATLAGPTYAQTGPHPTGAPEEKPTPTQNDATKPPALEEIVVTARKQVENNQKAPASIVAVSGSEVLARGITDPQGLEVFLPSVNLRRQGPVTQVFIRAVGARSDLPNFSAGSAFIYNGIIVQRYGTFGLTFDLDSVQSIAGPQGTLYGGSAAGGAINLFSAKPKTNGSGYANLEVGNLNALHASVAQNVSLSDTLSVRGAVDYNRRDSYNSAGTFRPNEISGRAALLFKPSSDFSAHVFYSHGSSKGRPSSTVFGNPLVFPDDPYRVQATGTNGNPIRGENTRQNNRNDLIGANIELNIDENTFTYIPGYVSFTAEFLQYVGLAGNRLDVFDKERQHSQELRWNRSFGALKANVGLFYLNNKTRYFLYQDRFTSPTAFNHVLLNSTDQVNESYAAYAQGILSASERLRFTAGGRISRDHIRASGIGGRGAFTFEKSHLHPDYKIGVDFDLADRILVYANVQTGQIPFGYNPDVLPSEVIPESKLSSLSGGIKSRFLDNRFELNAEVFHYTYKNFQAIQFVTSLGRSIILNSQEATIYGIDVSGRAQITPTTQLNASVVLLNGKFNKFEGVGYNYNGLQMVYAPKVSIQAGAQQTIELGRSGKLVGRVDSRYRSSAYASFQNFANTKLPSFTRTDVSLSYSPPGNHFSLTGFVRNVEDDAVYTTLAAPSATVVANGNFEAPRTYGVQFSAKW